jgi:hypothetical protein
MTLINITVVIICFCLLLGLSLLNTVVNLLASIQLRIVSLEALFIGPHAPIGGAIKSAGSDLSDIKNQVENIALEVSD